MKNIAAPLILASLAVVSGCAPRFGHQVDSQESHAVIEAVAPGKSVREAYGERERARLHGLPGGLPAVVVEVDSIDNITLPLRSGKTQSFRVRPGRHVITYRITAVGYFPENYSNPLIAVPSVLLGGGSLPGKSLQSKLSYKSKEMEAVAWRRYILRGFKVEERANDE